jgi:hypothetical protein
MAGGNSASGPGQATKLGSTYVEELYGIGNAFGNCFLRVIAIASNYLANSCSL